VTRGSSIVEVTTTSGYSSLVAVTSIWHWLEHEIDARGVDDGLGDGEMVVGMTLVWITVVGITWVEKKDCVMRMVETDVVPDRVNVDTLVDPGRVIVVKTVDAGKLIVESEVLKIVLAGS
jgi:hypothetical protein